MELLHSQRYAMSFLHLFARCSIQYSFLSKKTTPRYLTHLWYSVVDLPALMNSSSPTCLVKTISTVLHKLVAIRSFAHEVSPLFPQIFLSPGNQMRQGLLVRPWGPCAGQLERTENGIHTEKSLVDPLAQHVELMRWAHGELRDLCLVEQLCQFGGTITPN